MGSAVLAVTSVGPDEIARCAVIVNLFSEE